MAASAERDLSYLFVMTYGRSGSTLLMGLLNAIPGYLVRGENAGALRGLYDFHTACTSEADRRNPERTESPTAPFYGITGYDRAASLAAMRGLVVDSLLRPSAATRVLGFKEIRWAYDDLADYVAFLRLVFPGARFVVNTRNLDDVARSKWWAKREDAPEVLARIERRILEVADGLGDAAYRVHYDEYVADPGVLRGLHEWLGEPFDLAQVRATMAVPHSF
jgi:hypothetical protein